MFHKKYTGWLRTVSTGFRPLSRTPDNCRGPGLTSLHKSSLPRLPQDRTKGVNTRSNMKLTFGLGKKHRSGLGETIVLVLLILCHWLVVRFLSLICSVNNLLIIFITSMVIFTMMWNSKHNRYACRRLIIIWYHLTVYGTQKYDNTSLFYGTQVLIKLFLILLAGCVKL